MSALKFTYIGRRMNGKKLVYAYISELSTSWNLFAKPVLIANIGETFLVEATPTGVKGPYTRVGTATEKEVTKWSIEEVAAKEVHNTLRAAKIKPDGHVSLLIETVRKNTAYHERMLIARYVYAQLLKP